MSTNNAGFAEVIESQTFGDWLEAFNGNWSMLDGMPLPIEHGSNSQMEYIKLANGKVVLFGRIDYGTNYPCKNAAAGGNYVSDQFTLDFPIALVKNNPVVLPHVIANNNPDMDVFTRSVTYSQYKGQFLCPLNDASLVNSKVLNIIVIGDWK